ncbi:MAG: hypothetical protein ACREOZ_03665 [Gloeomargaritales cyanobacterium]
MANRLFFTLQSDNPIISDLLTLFGSPAQIIRIQSTATRDIFAPQIIDLLEQASSIYSNYITISSACFRTTSDAIEAYSQIPGYRGFGVVPASKSSPSQIRLFLSKGTDQPITTNINSNNHEEIQASLPSSLHHIVTQLAPKRFTSQPEITFATRSHASKRMKDLLETVSQFHDVSPDTTSTSTDTNNTRSRLTEVNRPKNPHPPHLLA